MPVIAMTREMGSGGREIAERVAAKLGLTVVLHELVEHDLAEHMHVRESAIHNLLEGGATLRERWQVGAKRLARYTAEELLDLAARGNVLIRGWGACVVLRDAPQVARIRVCAPIEKRERAVMTRSGLSDLAGARREIERNDAAHRRVLQTAYGVDREDPRLYDMVLNTERMSVETGARLICALVDSPEFHQTEAALAALRDKALEAHVRMKLRERFIAGTGVSNVDATADGGRVVVTGVAIHEALAADAGKLAAEVAGVKEVVNHINVVHWPAGRLR
jgi:cytidylate kinase